MKPYLYRFEKVLTFREQEKEETEVEYKKSVHSFEKVATELYELLKKKEDLEYDHQNKMKQGFNINDIHLYTRYLESIEKRISILQQSVIKARTKMNWFEEKLLEKTIEVKKFEKMKEKDQEHYRDEMELQEGRFLDELTTAKFHRRKTGW
ncbi:flagellar export protein FliJ [Sporosarcina thermotolerans]|uniref:Flagellar FliJ protein n=1 Tax=Sporosarcina thermotolerans TaxID=633404 RepID=A0AAW9A5F9_9BACL|nr:flagellar export protein FliJ [Sporosarcina thermotolerans]MDW0115733.1 flagellar export protein FliJ [Sporosarcina thermotolerans]